MSEQVDAENEFIAGSPVRALRAGKGFDQHYFFDTDPRRAHRLQQLKRDYPDKTIEITVGDANAGVQKLARRFHKSPYARGVAFPGSVWSELYTGELCRRWPERAR